MPQPALEWVQRTRSVKQVQVCSARRDESQFSALTQELVAVLPDGFFSSSALDRMNHSVQRLASTPSNGAASGFAALRLEADHRLSGDTVNCPPSDTRN
jgi:hypothetical protein